MILEATLRSLGVSFVAAILAGGFGMLLAWVVSRTDAPGGRHLSGLLALPYAIPAYLLGMAWVILGNPKVGLLKLPGQGSYGFWGMAFVEASVAFAFPYLELCSGFDRIDPALEEAARMSGAGPWRVFRDVSFPLLRPALLNGMLMAFLYAISAFGVPALLGMPVREFTLTTLIYSKLKLGGVEGLKAGFALSGILLGIAASGLGVSALLRSRQVALSGGKSSRPSWVSLGQWKWPASAFAWSFFFVTVILPWGALTISALAPVAGQYSPALWTLKNLRYVLTLPDFSEAFLNSIFLTAWVATIVVFGGFFLAFLAVRRKKSWAAVLVQVLGVPFSTPGTVLAMGVLFSAVLFARLGVPVNEPLLMMGVAYAIKYAAVGARSLVTAFSQVDPVLEEAARVSGARTLRLLWDIWVPLLKRSLSSAWWLAALPMLTELTMSVLLTGPGSATLGTILFELQEYADQPSAAALAWLLLTLALGVGAFTLFRAQMQQSRGKET